MNLIPAFDRVGPWVVLAAVPLGIVLLYFLKLRRQDVEVPSTYLWSRTIEDLHVNSLLQRLRTSLLLLLQLLTVGLAAFALFRPGVRDSASSQGRMVWLWDTSASMNAKDDDGAGGVGDASRFDLVRERLLARVDSMTDAETAMLVTFSDRAEVLQAFTSDRNRLRDAIGRASPTQRPTDILGALKAADGLANPRRSSEIGDVNDIQVADAMPADLMLYSDGGFQSVTEFYLGNLVPQYQAIGSASVRNVAITEFSADRDLQSPEKVVAFATVQNTGTEPAASNASLFLGTTLIDALQVDLEPGAESGLSFEVENDQAIGLRLVLEQEDALETDNRAFAALTPSGRVSVLMVTDENRPLELAFSTSKCAQIADLEVVPTDFLETDAFQKRATEGRDDLVVFDRCQPERMPATNTWFLGSIPGEDWKWASDASQINVIDLDRTHPLLRYLDLYSLLIFSGRAVESPKGAVGLVESDLGTVMSIVARGGYRDLIVGFPLVQQDDDGNTQANTNWYAERSWPVFVYNVLRHLAGAAQSSAAASYQPGQTVLGRVESAVGSARLKRTGAGGLEEDLGEVTIGEGGGFEITRTDQVGNYQLVSGSGDEERILERFVVNLFDVAESTIATKPEIELGFNSFEGQVGQVETRREYWPWLLWIVLAVLAAEWWLYSRRLA
ncbi:MAG: BatA and WFA domain-containing protein [Planctomycetota bacterium]